MSYSFKTGGIDHPIGMKISLDLMCDAGGCAASFNKHRTMLLPILLGRGAADPL